MRSLAILAAGMAAAAIFAPGAAGAATNLVTNGGFETGDFSSWRLSGDDDFSTVDGAFLGIAPRSGQFQALLGSRGGDDLEQDFATEIGDRYRIQFDLANDGAGPDYLEVAFDNRFEVVCVACSVSGYRRLTWDVTATFADNELDFIEVNRDFWFHLDNVSVTQLSSGAPEPGPWSLMIVGFAGAGAGLRAAHRRDARA